VDAVVRPSQPLGELAVEVVDVVETPARQEARFVVAVRAFDHSLGFGVVRPAEPHAHAERAAEGLELPGEDLAAATPLADATL
jgi:hypothetical protein